MYREQNYQEPLAQSVESRLHHRVFYYVQACEECNFTVPSCNTTSIVLTSITSTEYATSNLEEYASLSRLADAGVVLHYTSGSGTKLISRAISSVGRASDF